MQQDNVDKFEDEMQEIEKRLEAAGRSICSTKGSGESLRAINCALSEIRFAIGMAFHMRPYVNG